MSEEDDEMNMDGRLAEDQKVTPQAVQNENDESDIENADGEMESSGSEEDKDDEVDSDEMARALLVLNRGYEWDIYDSDVEMGLPGSQEDRITINLMKDETDSEDEYETDSEDECVTDSPSDVKKEAISEKNDPDTLEQLNLEDPDGLTCGKSPSKKRKHHPVNGSFHIHHGFNDEDPNCPDLKKYQFVPDRPPGVNFEHFVTSTTLHSMSPLKIFMSFFTMDMINDIVECTNGYASTKISENPDSYMCEEWKQTSSEEIYRLIGVLMYMGLVRHPQELPITLYWNGGDFWGGEAIRKVMTYDRFKALMLFLHVVDPTKEPNADHLSNIRAFSDKISNKCESLYQPFCNISIDERTVKTHYEPDSGIRQFNDEDQLVRCGYKLWALMDSLTGYICKLYFYTGESQASSQNDLGYDVVMSLTEGLKNQGYQLYVDKYYTSPNLLRDLLEKGILCCGLCRETRKHFPRPLHGGLDWARTVKRGMVRWLRDANTGILYQQWRGRILVTLASTIHDAKSHVLSTTYKLGHPTKFQIPKPLALKDYVKYSYSDRVAFSDDMWNSYKVVRKCLRWWTTLFYQCINIAVVNSYVIFRSLQKQHPEVSELQRERKYDYYSFQIELFEQLLKFNLGKPSEESRTQDKQAASHLPKYMKKQLFCVRCKKVLTHVKCATCDMPICVSRKGIECYQYLHRDFYQE